MARTPRPTLPDDIDALVSGLRWIACGAAALTVAVVVFWAVLTQLRFRELSDATVAWAPVVLYQSLWAWVGQPFPGTGRSLLFAWGPPIAVGIAAFVIWAGKWIALGGIDDGETRSLVLRSLALDLLGWALAFTALAMCLKAVPFRHLTVLFVLGNASVVIIMLAADSFLSFVRRAALFLQHSDLQVQALSLRRWMGVFLLACVINAGLQAALTLPWFRQLKAANQLPFFITTLVVQLVTAALCVVLLVRGASTALRLRKPLLLSAEAKAIPAPQI